MDIFKTYIINLINDVEKYNHMRQQCVINDLDALYLKAIEGKKLDIESIGKVYDSLGAIGYLGRELTSGELGCALSHIEIYKKMILDDIDVALILEDDVEFAFTYSSLIKLINELPSDWECVLLGHHSGYSRKVDALASHWFSKAIGKITLIRFAERPVGGYAYLINDKGALKRLGEFQKITYPIDNWDCRKLNIYGVSPSIFKIATKYKEGSSLDLERSVMFYERSFHEKIKDFSRKWLIRIGLIGIYFLIRRIFLRFRKLNKYSNENDLNN